MEFFCRKYIGPSIVEERERDIKREKERETGREGGRERKRERHGSQAR